MRGYVHTGAGDPTQDTEEGFGNNNTEYKLFPISAPGLVSLVTGSFSPPIYILAPVVLTEALTRVAFYCTGKHKH
uniref:Uncharacterized protein n=1 Tax=Knipowitschia caucasica TaxID=637954 RepID=A0AAV2JMP4_KNICA